MTLIENLLIFLAIITIYVLIVFILHKKGILKKYNISLWGPALMWRTLKGRNFLKNIARKERFWTIFGNVGIGICFITMVIMLFFLIWQSWLILGFTPQQIEQLPGPEVALVLPGINPILPLEYLGYIILALVVAVIVHEFSHGILTFVSKLKVKSLGILYLIIPLGAFCEPDEEELKKAKTKSRMRIYAAGPLANFVVVLISILLFSFIFMSAVQPAAQGVAVFYIGDDTPAEKIGLAPGMIMTSINDTKITNISGFFSVMEKTRANQTINISYVYGENTVSKSVILEDKYNYTSNLSNIGQGYLGVGPSPYSYEKVLLFLKNPFVMLPDSFMIFYMVPLLGYFQGYNPIVSPFTDAYVITGPLSVIPPGAFWIIVNALYWIFWLNFAVAIFNVLPMVPLDGGYLFKDAIDSIVRKVRKGLQDEKREKIVMNISFLISIMILLLIIFPWIVKYLFPWVIK